MATLHFKGFDDYIDLFSAGEQTDSAGNTRIWTQAELDQMVANHSAESAAPAVVGHPSSDAPAYGWLSDVRRNGDTLQGKFDQVNPDFEQAVRSGSYKNRSISLDHSPESGFSIRHVGWLGGVAPAIPGLRPVQFSSEAPAHTFTTSALVYEESYAWSNVAKLLRGMREFFISEKGQERADELMPNYSIQELSDHATTLRNTPINPSEPSPAFGRGVFSEPTIKPTHTNPGGAPVTVTQEQLDAANARAATAEAQIATFEKENATAAAALAAEKEKVRRADFSKKVDALIADRRILPASRDGVIEFMMSLPADEAVVIEFSAGDSIKKQSPSAWFSEFAAALPQVGPKLGVEMTPESGPPTHNFSAPEGYQVDTAAAALHGKALEYQATHKCDYITAVNAVEVRS